MLRLCSRNVPQAIAKSAHGSSLVGAASNSSSSRCCLLRCSRRYQTSSSASSSSSTGLSSTSSASSSSASNDSSSIESSYHLRENLKVAIYWDIPPTLLKQGEKPMKPFVSDQPIAVGHISARFSDNVYAVTIDELSLSHVIEVGSRVFLRADVLGINNINISLASAAMSTTPGGQLGGGGYPQQQQMVMGVMTDQRGGMVAMPAIASQSPPIPPRSPCLTAQPVVTSSPATATADGNASSTIPLNSAITNPTSFSSTPPSTVGGAEVSVGQQTPPTVTYPMTPSPAAGIPPTAPVLPPKLELVAGLVARVNANGTYSILLDNDRFENAVPRSFIAISEGRSRFIHNDSYARILHWVRNAGVDRRSDQESTATILYHRGWREDKLYLLESDDVHCLSHLNKAVRMCLLERAEWERDHHRQRRELSKERLKEKEWRYVITKYSGVVSAFVAVLGVCSIFTWNFKNWHKQQRSYQLKQATETLRKRCTKPSNYRVKRKVEDELRRAFRTLDLSHPRLMVCIGPLGAGKSSVIRAAAASEELSVVSVDIRGSDDPLRSLVKALGVVNIDACGDLMDFVAESCRIALEASGHAPLIVFKLRDERTGGLSKVYHEGVALACDRACCHVIVEINEESMRVSDATLPRCNYFSIPPFDLSEVHSYTDRNIDPYDLAVFADVCGTNSTDLDDLVANVVVSEKEEAHRYTRRKLEKAMRHLQLLWAKDPIVKGVLTSIGQRSFEEGLRMRRAEIAPAYAAMLNEIKYAMSSSSSSSASTGSGTVISELKDLIYYNPLKDGWMFRSKVYHSAASCWSPPISTPHPVGGK